MKELLLSGAAALGITVDEDVCKRFEIYAEFLEKQNEKTNLTAVHGADEIAVRHFLDSLTMLKAVDFEGKRVVDVGTGAGFPGVPIKLAVSSVRLTLLDSLNKRIDFLKELGGILKLSPDTEYIHARAEELAQLRQYREQYDIAVSRAVARLNMLSELCLPFVKVGGCFLAMKAEESEEEVKEAQKAIEKLGGRLEGAKSVEVGGVRRSIIVVSKVEKTDVKYPRRFAKIKKSPL